MTAIPRLVSLALLLVLRIGSRVPVLAAIVVMIVFTAPGFDSDERQLDMRLSSESIRHLNAEQRIPAWQAGQHWLTACLRGDLGQSRVFNRPVAELLSERIPITARSVAYGLLLGWTAALSAAALTAAVPMRAAEGVLRLTDTVILCTPAALTGFLAVLCRAPVEAAVAAIVFARAHTWMTRIHRDVSTQPWTLSAHSFGITRWRILIYHILPQIWPQVAAVLAGSVTLAIGTSVPLEVVCDMPGLGQLAWRATLGRDLPVLLAVTLCMAACTITAGCISDAVRAQQERPAA